MKKMFTQLSLVIISICSFALLLVIQPVTVQAVAANDWKAGNIIDDGLFYNGNDMSAGDIQAFLNSKVPNCDTYGVKTSELGGGTRAQYAASRGYSTPFTCLKDFSMSVPGYGADSYCGAISAGSKSAASIIKEVSSACGIGSKVLLVLLQKEQRLVTDEWPLPNQYQKATGFACPDTAPCDAQYAGYFNQVYRAARQYKVYRANPASYRYKARQNNAILFNPDAGCGSSNVYIENDATAGLYIYTPYQPNQAALNNMYGTGDGCSAYGNRNFWRMYSDWFGTTRGAPFAWQYVTQYAYTDQNKTTSVNLANVSRGQRVYLGVQAKNVGATTWTNSGSNPVRLGTSSPQNRNSAFCDNTWVSCARPANLYESSVAPGQVGTFEFWYNIPASGGTYNEYFNLLAEGLAWMNDLGLYFHTAAQPPTYTWQYVTQYAYTDDTKSTGISLESLAPNQRVYIGFQAKNTGNVTWVNSGGNPTRAATNAPQNRNSPFCDPSWVTCARPANLKEASVAPGQTGTFEFWYKAPSTVGEYREAFRPLTEGLAWMNDPGLFYFTRVNRPLLNPGSAANLSANQSLTTNESRNSNDKRYQLIMQGDGNLVIYSPNRAIWASGTSGNPGSRLVMQGDGNLVIYNASGRPIWHTGTNGRGSSNLVMQNDGNLVIYNASGGPTWYTATNGQL